MIESYFFIPGSHPKLAKKIRTIAADKFIIDLEDAFDKQKQDLFFDDINQIGNHSNLWIRPSITVEAEKSIHSLRKLVDQGYYKLVLPKIQTPKQVKEIENVLGSNLEIIILVENAICLNNLDRIIESSKSNLVGLGFGSQDYCSYSRMKHSHEVLVTPRFIIANTAKAYGIKCIDIACMDITGDNLFKNELRHAFDFGFDGKFIIHPKQLEILKSFSFYSFEEIKEAESILKEYEKQNKPPVFLYDNKVIEPPHIRQINKIITWSKRYGKKQNG